MTLPKKLSKLLLFPLFAVSLFALEKDALAASVTKISVGDSSVINSGSSASHGDLEYAYCGYANEGVTEWRALFKFDLSDIPSSAVVSAAKLRLYKRGIWGTAEMKTYVLRNTTDWAETTVKWANQPDREVLGIETTIHSSDTWVAWEVTELVKKWISGDYQNYGVTLTGQDTGSYRIVSLATKEDSGGRKPELVIDYTIPLSPGLFKLKLPSFDTSAPGISDVSATGVTDTQAVISWKTSENATSFVDYGKTVAYGLSTGSEDKVSTHSVILSNLEPETAYHFRVRSKDAAGNEATSGDYNFETTAEVEVGETAPAPPDQPGAPPAGSPGAPVGGTAPGVGVTGPSGQTFEEYQPGDSGESEVGSGSGVGGLKGGGILGNAGWISKILWGVVGVLALLILAVSGFLVYTLIGKRKGASAGGIDGVVGKKRSRKKSKEYEE